MIAAAGTPVLIDGLPFGGRIADRAFDSNAIIADLNARGAKIVLARHPGRAFAPGTRCRPPQAAGG